MQSALSQPKEFHERRIKGIGGSEVASILGLSPYKSAYQLWLEKTKRIIPEDISHLPHVIRGILGERTARDLIERKRLKRFVPRQWQGKKEWHLCSDDGWNVDENSLLEIKCMGRANHEAAGQGKIPAHYMCQIQWNLFVSQAAHAFFVSFRPEDETMHEIQVAHDLVEQEKITAAVDAFWLVNVKGDKPPQLTDMDYVEIADPTLSLLLSDYQVLSQRAKIIEAQLEGLVEKLKPYTATQRAVRCGQARMLRSERQGTIDYKALLADYPEMNVDPEKYRKKPTESFRVSFPPITLTGI